MVGDSEVLNAWRQSEVRALGDGGMLDIAGVREDDG
jgi:hypothetical protein